MAKPHRILVIADSKDYTDKLLLTDIRKRVKGFLRLGHDTQVFSPNIALRQIGGIDNKLWIRKVYKPRMDEMIVRQIKNYRPDVILIAFAKCVNRQTVSCIRDAARGACLAGYDVDIYPELQRGRVDTAAGLDVLLTTYAGHAVKPYTDKGVRCVFMPNICDPDVEYRYPVSAEWNGDILFTGKLAHSKFPTDEVRSELLTRLAQDKRFTCYGSLGRRFIGGLEYYYAISGAKIGLSINADNSIPLYHSDRLTQYLSCGTCVLAKRVPESEKLFGDKRHVRYFDTAEEFFDQAAWYLAHEQERLELANAGMEHVHQHYHCEKIARYTLDVIEKGMYHAPWNA